MNSLSGETATLAQRAYEVLCDALRSSRRLARDEANALYVLLLHLRIASELLDAAPDAPCPEFPTLGEVTSYRYGIATSAVEAFRRELAALMSPPTSPAAPDPGLFEAGAMGSSLAQPSRSDAGGGLEAIGSASDARPGAGGAGPQPVRPAGGRRTA